MLNAFPPANTYDDTPINNMDSANTSEEKSDIDNPEPVLAPVDVNGNFVTSAATWKWVGCNSVYSQPDGTTSNVANLAYDDGSLSVFSEEWDGSNWLYEAVYLTPVSYQHQYIHKELRLEFTQDWSLAPENLKFYVALCDASGVPGVFGYVTSLDSTIGALQINIDGYLEDLDLLTSRRVAVKVQGAIESGDWGQQNTWRFDFLGIGYKDHQPSLNSHGCDVDEDFTLYPHLGSFASEDFAEFSQTVFCRDGYAEIEYVKLQYSDSTDWWVVNWDDGIWSIDYHGDADSSWAELVESECTTSTTTYTRTVSFAVRINWGHPTATASNGKVRFMAFGSDIEVSSTYDYAVESRLDMQTAPTISESTVPRGTTCTFSGDLEYYGSPGHWSPPSHAVDIEVRRSDPSATGWTYDAQPASDGTFTVNPSTASTSAINTFELRVVADGTTTNLLTSTYSDTVGGDRVVVSSGSVGSDDYNAVYGGGVRITGLVDTLFLELEWESSGTPITSATSVSWASSENTVSMDYTSGHWEGDTYARSSVGEQTYGDLTVYVSGTEYTVVSEPSYNVLWDEIETLTTVIEGGDDYVNLGNSITIRVTAKLSHLGHALEPGLDTLYMNGIKMSDGGSYFTYTISRTYPTQLTFSVDDSNALESTYGITKIASGKPSVTCVWDTHMVDISVDYAHVDIDDNVRVWAHVTRAWDGSILTDTSGSVTLRHSTSGDITMTYSSDDQMWYADVTQSDVGQWVYYIYSISDTAEGISTVGRGLNFDGSNDYVDCGSHSSLDLTSNLTLSAWFYGDGTNWGSGMYILAKKDDNNAQYALYIHPETNPSYGELRLQYYNGALRAIEIKSDITRNAWHHVTVTILGTTVNAWFDGEHILVDDTLPIALDSYSSVPLLIGAQTSGAGTSGHFEGFVSDIRVYSTELTDLQCELLYQGQYPVDTNLRLLLGRSSIDSGSWLWSDTSTNSNDGSIYGALTRLGTIPMSGDEVVRPIWDQVKVTGYSSDTPTIDVGSSSSTHVTLVYSFSNDPVDDGTVNVNGIFASPSTTSGEWDFSETKYSAQAVIYNSMEYSGGKYDLSSENQNGETLTQEWDEILIEVMFVPDSIIDIGTECEIRVTARLNYNNQSLKGFDDELFMNGVKMNWSSSEYFYYRTRMHEVGTWNFYVNATGALEDEYGITVVNLNGTNVNVTWTGVIVDFTDPFLQILDVDQNATGITYAVTYAHDGTHYDGSLSLNNTIFSYDVAGRYGYGLQTIIGDDSLGISYIVQDDDTYCIWESIIASISEPIQQTLLLGQSVSGIVVTGIYAYSGLKYNGSFTLNDTIFTYHTEGQRGYTVESCSGDPWNITVISVNDVTFATWVDGYPVEIHISESLDSILVSTEYDPKCFEFEIWITNSTEDMIAGWLALTIGDDEYSVYADGITNASFSYYPELAGDYCFEANFEGDGISASASKELGGLVVESRLISYEIEIPSTMVAMVDTTILFHSIYDKEYSGTFEEVTYANNLPINTTVQMWWTISELFEEPLTYAGIWSINNGNGFATWALPWDLNGDNLLSETDFECYLVIIINGQGIYESSIINTPITILQPLQLDLEVPPLTYSDTATISIQLSPYFDEAYSEGLDIPIELLVSNDNSTWINIENLTTNADGYGSISWTCLNSSPLFFKAVTDSTEYYSQVMKYTFSPVNKETTLLAIIDVGQFTFSDQGILYARLSTNDGEPLVGYIVGLEINDDNIWISIGTAATNATGHVSIPWGVELPGGEYSIKVRTALSESQLYEQADEVFALVSISKEVLHISIDAILAEQGLITVKVMDDENSSIESITVNLYTSDIHLSGITDEGGYVQFHVTLENGEIVRVEVEENDYYEGASSEFEVQVPLNPVLLISISVVGIIGLGFVSIIRKKHLEEIASRPVETPVKTTLALEAESESMEKRSTENLEAIEKEVEEIRSESVEPTIEWVSDSGASDT